MIDEKLPIVIVGAGLSGAVLAERCATVLSRRVIVLEKRPHVAGNCYDYLNDDGIMVSKYGAHIFHTSDAEVWRYVNRFSKWRPYKHRVLSSVGGKLVPVPINIDTVNSILGLSLSSPEEMEAWLHTEKVKHSIGSVTNSEEAALARFGNIKLYNLMFKEYTYKQWSLWPHELEPSVLERIPIRLNHNDRYFNDTYEAIPEGGYTKFVQALLNDSLIEVRTNTDYFDVRNELEPYDKLIYTGPIDRFYDGKFDKLEYRSLRFEFETYNKESHQPVAVINFPSLEYPYTRMVEYKKLYGGISSKTTVVKEFPTWYGEPYYPVPTEANRLRYDKYKKYAKQSKDVIFAGRLANYKYFNMDQAIRNSLDIFNGHFSV